MHSAKMMGAADTGTPDALLPLVKDASAAATSNKGKPASIAHAGSSKRH